MNSEVHFIRIPVNVPAAKVLLSSGGAHCANIVHSAGNVTP